MDKERLYCVLTNPSGVTVVSRAALWLWATSQRPYFFFGAPEFFWPFSRADPLYFMVSSGEIRRLEVITSGASTSSALNKGSALDQFGRQRNNKLRSK